MKIKLIPIDVICEGENIGSTILKVPVFTTTEIRAMRDAATTKFGTGYNDWLWYTTQLREDTTITEWLRENTPFFNCFGIGNFDTFQTGANATKLDAFKAWAVTSDTYVDFTNKIMARPAGYYGGSSGQYERREIILRNKTDNTETRFIHSTYNPAVSSTGTHESTMYPTDNATGYGYTSTSYFFGVCSQEYSLIFCFPYIVYDDTLANYQGWGKIATLLSSGNYGYTVKISRDTLFTNQTQGYITNRDPYGLNGKNFLLSSGRIIDPSEGVDPYEQGGTSETGGGTGTFTIDSDAISVPPPPTLSAVDTGLVSLYTPTLAQLQALASYLWNADATTVDWWKKLIANPLDLILGLSIVPVAVPTSGAVSVKVGLIDTQISMNKASSQYVQVDCGSLDVVEFYGAALDYLPFRKTSIYLPFIGTRTISTDDIMGKTLQVVYNIDLLSGALTAMIKCGDAVLYQYSGSCAMSIPLSGQTFTDMITSTIQLAAGIGATVASGGAAAGIMAANAANSVMSMKPTVERAGGVSGAAGQLAVMKPYLIGEIPRQSVPENYNKFAGYPSNIKATLSDLSGYTEIETVYLEGIAATDSELNEIETLLKGGVFL